VPEGGRVRFAGSGCRFGAGDLQIVRVPTPSVIDVDTLTATTADQLDVQEYRIVLVQTPGVRPRGRAQLHR
jgi:hypothetical protein